jgi:ribosomal protein S18 acetylase RimI-like enzyme
MEFEIREFQPDDQPAVWELHRIGLQQYGVDFGDGPWDDDLRDIPTAYAQNRGQFLVAADGERLIGMGGVRQIDCDVAEIKRMRVHPEFQRQGIGTAILERLESTARGLGFRTIVLDTTEEQVPAQRFYAKHGFVRLCRSNAQSRGSVEFQKKL